VSASEIDLDTALRIDASVDEVRRVLAESLSPEQLAHVRIDQCPPPAVDPFAPRARRDLPSASAVVTFVAGALVGGALYDVVKAASLALAAHFRERLATRGDARVSVDDDDSPSV